ncbi:ATP12 family chaperone protein [Rhizobium sp. NFR03]|uniref:ATP12 family chaperone protein n=1 Tax=Rhizobium sp. NFR03 TaxID=1566263 RepID=UPI0008D72FB6|nr:ATP12 family chaperone protein [Rhizobium sp. NFR03]SES09149.1 Chaperone required for the assembly of the F1-ATPase [Rhizobium sp. NFR03]
MPDIRDDFENTFSDPDPVRRAQIQMLKPLPKRFYKDVSIGRSEGDGFAVLLDGRTVKTPAKQVLAVPTESLAELLAAEWEAQVENIDPATMPVTRLVNTALDGVAKDIRGVFDDILNFAGTDMLCYRADQPEGLVARQQAQWDPVLSWVSETFGARFILAEGVIHQRQPQAAISAFAEALRAYATPLGLSALHAMTTLTGSAILPLAIAEGRLSVVEAWALAHLDEDWQIEHWGTDDEAFQRRELRWRDMQAANAVLDSLRTT